MTTTRLLAQLAAIGAGGLGDIPGLAQLRDLGAVADVTERWRTDEGEVDIVGTLILDGDYKVPLGSLSVAIGSPGGELAIPFTITVDAQLLETVLLILSVRANLIAPDAILDLLESHSQGADLSDPEALATAMMDALRDTVGLLGDTRVSVGPVPAYVNLPEDWLRPVTPITEASGAIIRLEPTADAGPVSILLGAVTLDVSASGIEIDFDGPSADSFVIEIPPVMIADTGVAIMMTDVVWHRGGDLPDGVTDFQLPAEWQGLIIGTVTLWGLDQLLPGAPEGRADQDPGAEISLNDWVIDDEGLRGHLSVTMPDDPESQVDVTHVDLEFDRSWWPTELSVHVSLDVGTAVGTETHAVDLVADLRINPEPGSWSLAVTAEAGDGPLVSIKRPGLGGIGAAAALLAGVTGDTDAALIIGGIAALETTGYGRVTSLDIDHIAAAVRPEVIDSASGPERARVIELTVSARIMLELSLDSPVAVELGAGNIAARIVVGADPVDRPRVSIDWSLAAGLDVTLPSVIDIGGILVVRDVGLRRISDGLVIELAVDSSGAGDVAVGGLPDALAVTYRPRGTPPIEIDLRQAGAPMTLLIPGVLYATGTLKQEPAPGAVFAEDGHSWGEITRGKLSAFLIGNGTARSPEDHLAKSSYALDLEIGVLSATRDDGMRAFVLTADAGFRPGLPIGPSGASLYGLGLTFAMNGAPSVEGGDYAGWFLETLPMYSTAAEKWRPEAGGWAFGAAATLGSGPDDGRSWNVGTGLFFLLPGPVILITGEGDLFSALPSLPAQGGDPDDLSFAFGAIISLDFGRRIFSASLRGELEKKAGDATLVKAVIPADVTVALDDPSAFSLSVGRPEPIDDRVQIAVLGLFDASAYALLSGQDVILPGVQPPLTLPGLAFAFGAAGGIDRRLSAGPARVVLWARAGFDVGLSLSLPLAAGRVFVEGGVEVSIFGIGLSLEASLELMAMAPRPFMLMGSVGIKVGLPWPIPDFSAKAKLVLASKKVWADEAPEPEPPVETLTLWGRGTGTPIVVKPGENGTNVPLDAIAQLAFSVPVGNDSPALGSVLTDGDDSANPVWQVATTETDEDGFERRHGYRHRLNSITITRRSPGGGVDEANVPGFWPGGTALGSVHGLSDDVPRVSGGVVARTNVRLWGIEDPVAARVGGGGELVARWIDSWDPCVPRRLNEKERMRLYTARSLESRLREKGFVPPLIKHRIPAFDKTLAERIRHRVGRGQVRIREDILAWRLEDAASKARTRFLNVPPATVRELHGIQIAQPVIVDDVQIPIRVRQPISRTPVVPIKPTSRIPGRIRGRVPQPEDRVPSGEGRIPEETVAVEPSLTPLRQVVEARLDLIAMPPEELDSERILDRVAPTGRLPIWWTRKLSSAPIPVGEVLVLPNETPPDEEVARARVEPQTPDGEILSGLAGITTEPARLVRNPATRRERLLPHIEPDDPVFALPRVILPVALGEQSTSISSFMGSLASRLRIDVTDTEKADAALLVAPGVGIVAWQTAPDGSEQILDVLDETDIHIGDQRIWRRVRVSSTGPVIALSFAAFHGPLDVSEEDEAAVALLVSIEARPPMINLGGAQDRHRDSTDTSVQVLVDAANTWDGTGSPAGILAPGATFDVVVDGITDAVTEGRIGLETGSASFQWSRKFTFTTSEELPGGLRAHPGEAPLDGRVATEGTRESDWDVAMSPGDGAPAHYTDVPLLVRLRDARTVAVADATDHDLRLRLVDERGKVTEHLGGIDLADTVDVDAHVAALKERLAEFPCVAGGNGGDIWREARMALPDFLEPRTRYIAHFEGVPRGGGEVVALHEWRFRTSAYANATDHLDAHIPVDDVVPVESIPSLGASAPGGLHIDDDAFDDWLVTRLGIPAHAAPDDCELVRIWAWDPDPDTAVCHALLFDGPEPLLRDPVDELRTGSNPVVLRHGGTGLPITVVTGVARSRLLIIPAEPLPAGNLEVAIRSRGSTSARSVQIPNRPANLNRGP